MTAPVYWQNWWYSPVPSNSIDLATPACRGLHLMGSYWLNHWREGEMVKTRCPYCNATWEVRVP